MKTIFEEKYAKLNKAQKEVVDTIEGPVMVVAGPGTGKTTIITLRIANILEKTDTPASGILAITFTESGVKSLRDKLFELIGERAYDVKIHTFHGFAGSIMAEFPEHFTHIHRYTQMNEIEAESLVRNILMNPEMKPLRPFGDPDYYIPHIIRAISASKREAKTPHEIKKFAEAEIKRLQNDELSVSSRGATKGELKAVVKKQIEKLEKTVLFAEVMERYEAEKKKALLLDYDDLIFELLLALGNDELLKRLLQEKFLYLHIDEHQDTNDAQNFIIKLLGDFYPNPNVCIVGDEKQAIYRFQGASVENFLKFRKLYPEMKLIALTENYRSPQSILDASFKMIEKNYGENEHQELRVRLKAGSRGKPIEILSSPNITVTETWVCENAEKVLKKSDHDTVAVIVRNNRELDRLVNAFEARGIRVEAQRSVDIFRDPAGAVFFSLVKFVLDLTNIEALGRTVLSGLWGLTFLEMTEILQSLRRDPLSTTLTKLPKIEVIEKELSTSSPLVFVYRLAEESGYLNFVKCDLSRIEVWRGIVSLAEQLARKGGKDGIRNPRELLEAMIQYETSISRKLVTIETVGDHSRIHIMTAHKSKGLEYDFVYIPFAVEELWSSKKKASSFVLPFEENLDEESSLSDSRRLFYVAITRAKKHVVIITPESDGEREFTPVRFISELDPGEVSHDSIHYTEKSPDNPYKPINESDKIHEYAKKIIEEKGLSVTALNHFIECPSKFLIKSILKMPEMPNATSEKGNAMHLAMYNVASLSEKTPESIHKEIVRSISDHLSTSLLPSFEKQMIKAELEKHALSVARSLSSHFNQEGKMFRESWFETRCGKHEVRLHGKLDLVVEQSEMVRVYDYKTRSKMSVNEIRGETKSSNGDYFRQLVFYKMLLMNQSNFNGKDIIPSLIFLTPDSRGVCENLALPITAEDLSNLEEQINRLVEAVYEGLFISDYCEDKLCEYCAMKKMM